MPKAMQILKNTFWQLTGNKYQLLIMLHTKVQQLALHRDTFANELSKYFLTSSFENTVQLKFPLSNLI